jgi:hypothetical protein
MFTKAQISPEKWILSWTLFAYQVAEAARQPKKLTTSVPCFGEDLIIWSGNQAISGPAGYSSEFLPTAPQKEYTLFSRRGLKSGSLAADGESFNKNKSLGLDVCC